MSRAAVRRDWVSLGVLMLGAIAFAVGVLVVRGRDAANLVAYDFYGQFYPFMVHAWRSLSSGGGLLWNPYQDCGQPFFGNSQTGLLYPVNVVFAVLPREPAVIVSVIINLAIAGVGMFQLCREMRIGRVASLCGALAFQLGWATSMLASWSPTHIAPFAWLPVAMWRTERLLRAPSLRAGLWLALVLAIQLLPGFPQTVFFTYQVIALRVLWTLLTRQTRDRRAVLPALALGLVAPLLLDAVQLLPSMEVARESVRQGPVSDARLGAIFSWSLAWQTLAAQIAEPGNALILLIALVGVAAARRLKRGSDAAFYALTAALYFVLSLGPGTIVYALYARLPLGSTFRGPARLLWVTNFAVAVLVALGSEALLALDRSARTRLRVAAALLAGTVLLYLVSASTLRPIDLVVIAGLLAWVALPLPPAVWRFAPLALVALIACTTLVLGRAPVMGLRSGDVYGRHADVFDFVRARLTPQDRVLIVGGQPALDLMAKSSTLFALPNIHDYDPQASLRYAEFYTYLRTARHMRDFEDWYWIFDKLLPASLQRPLFDLTGARYLIVAPPLDATQRAFGNAALRLLLERDGVRVYENDQAMPRARYVPRVGVRNDGEVLPALADRSLDLRREAIVSADDRARLSGPGGDGTGTVEFVSDDPERIVLRVQATAPGFVLLADEYFPGWTATVNGEPRAIVRANHAFRLVEVPAGTSEVVFVYRPRSVLIGGVITLLAVIGCVVLWRRGRNPSV
jgi:hypothetical protein